MVLNSKKARETGKQAAKETARASATSDLKLGKEVDDGLDKEEKKEKFPFWLFALAGISVLGVSFFIFSSLAESGGQEVAGVVFKTQGTPSDAIRAALAGKSDVVVSADFRSVSDVSCISSMLVQVSLALGASNKTLDIQGQTTQNYCVDRLNTTFSCRQPDVIVAHGDCDCVEIRANQIKISGSDKFLCDKSGTIGEIITASLGGVTVTREQAGSIIKSREPAQAGN